MSYILPLLIAGVVGYIVAKDAESRGMNGPLWGVFTFLIMIVAVPVYLIVRKPKQ